jgi:hypothetical protein
MTFDEIKAANAHAASVCEKYGHEHGVDLSRLLINAYCAGHHAGQPKADERGSAEPCATCGGRGVVARSFRDGDDYDACPECNTPHPPTAPARDGSEPGLITGDEGKYTAVEYKLGAWLSAALNDDETCAEFRADIEAWMRQIEQRAEPQGLTDEQIVLLWQSEVGRDHPDTIDKVRFSRALLVLAARASAGKVDK